jgi:kynurenine formamidase
MSDAIAGKVGLWSVVAELRAHRFVDLTHAFEPGIPKAPDMPDEERRRLYDFPTDGFCAHLYTFAGQWGTHLDAPLHFVEDGRPVDAINVREMVLPLVVFDLTARAATDSDFALSADDILAWEREHVPLPAGCFAALRTGWSERWPDHERMFNRDEAGTAHFPGWGLDAVEFLLAERDVVAIGHETTDTDPGCLVTRDEFPAETRWLQAGKFQIELLADLGDIPPAGGVVVCTVAKPRGGSGFPARVFAILPG